MCKPLLSLFSRNAVPNAREEKLYQTPIMDTDSYDTHFPHFCFKFKDLVCSSVRPSVLWGSKETMIYVYDVA